MPYLKQDEESLSSVFQLQVGTCASESLLDSQRYCWPVGHQHRHSEHTSSVALASYQSDALPPSWRSRGEQTNSVWGDLVSDLRSAATRLLVSRTSNQPTASWTIRNFLDLGSAAWSQPRAQPLSTRSSIRATIFRTCFAEAMCFHLKTCFLLRDVAKKRDALRKWVRKREDVGAVF